jgi:hypothetical protein
VLGTVYHGMEVTKEKHEKKPKNEKTSASTLRESLKLALGSIARRQFPSHHPPRDGLQVWCPKEILVMHDKSEKTSKDAS